MKTIGIIGLGNMGFALWQYLQQNEYDVVVYDPYVKAEEKVKQLDDISEIWQRASIVLVCVKPNKVQEILRTAEKATKVVSIAAGVSITSMAESLPTGSAVVRLMPNLPLLVGQGCIGYFGAEELYLDVEEVFSQVGKVFRLNSEQAMDAFTAIAGSGPAFVLAFAQAMAEGGVLSGIPYQESLQWVLQTMQGTVALLGSEMEKNPAMHPGTLRNRVTSPGGTTIEGLKYLEKGKMNYVVMEAVYQTYLKAKGK
ncbi:MAG: pyrroline-5-carboxylate reductase [Spirochaetota bacterium]